jgi:phosphopantetheine--protein transferase-like protein
METAVQLRKAVAEFFEVDEGQVGPSFSLSGRRGQGSIARAALDSVIRNRVGIKSRAVYTARTFGELEEEIVPGAADIATAPAPVPGPVELPAGGHAPPAAGSVSCGVDIESIENLPAAADYWEDPFYRTVFSPSEIAYCVLQETPALHFAARWCAKEALKKCDRELLAADLKDLEVVPDEAGAPYFVQHAGGASRRLPHAVSLSHTSQAAVAVVIRAIMPEPAATPLAVTHLVPPVVAEPRSWGSKLLIALNLVALGVAVLALLRTFPSVAGLFAR